MAGFKGLFPSCLSLPVKCVARKEATAGRAAGLPGGAVFPGELTYWQEAWTLSQPSPRRAIVRVASGLFLPSHFAKILVQRLLRLTHSQQPTGAADSSCNVSQGDGSDNVHLASAQIMGIRVGIVQ